MDLQKEWHKQELNNSEQEELHTPVEHEYLFYHAVQSGDVDYVMQDCKSGGFDNLAGKGTLSKNSLTNIKYHFIVTTALVTRSCTAAGMVQEQAYRLSDFYINKMDECQSVAEVCELHHQMVLDFTNKMKRLQNNMQTSKAISKSIEYIYNNLNKRITVEDLAEYLDLSPSYLSRLFKKELDVSVSDYIREKKIEKAKNLLQYSDYSFIDIANYLAFASQSHFIKIFEKYVGVTPKKYRDKYYRTNWSTDNTFM